MERRVVTGGPDIQRLMSQAEMQAMQQQQQQQQMTMVVRMFIAETSRTIYTNSIEHQQEKFNGPEDFRKLAEASQDAAMILAETLGMIQPRTQEESNIVTEED